MNMYICIVFCTTYIAKICSSFKNVLFILRYILKITALENLIKYVSLDSQISINLQNHKKIWFCSVFKDTLADKDVFTDVIKTNKNHSLFSECFCGTHLIWFICFTYNKLYISEFLLYHTFAELYEHICL